MCAAHASLLSDEQCHPNDDASQAPLPELNERIEKEIVVQGRKRASLAGGVLPSIVMVTLVDAKCSMCVATVSNDSSLVAAGFADSSVRLCFLKVPTPTYRASPYVLCPIRSVLCELS